MTDRSVDVVIALKPFAELAAAFSDIPDEVVVMTAGGRQITAGDLRTAREVHAGQSVSDALADRVFCRDAQRLEDQLNDCHEQLDLLHAPGGANPRATLSDRIRSLSSVDDHALVAAKAYWNAWRDAWIQLGEPAPDVPEFENANPKAIAATVGCMKKALAEVRGVKL